MAPENPPAPPEPPPSPPPRRLALLCLASFGVYELLWFARQWRWVARKQSLSVSPWGRALLAPVYAFPLFQRVLTLAYERGCTVFRFPRLLAASYLLLAVTRLSNPLGFPALFAFLPVLVVAQALGEYRLKESPGAAAPAGLSRWELALVLLALPFWALRLLWAFLPD